MKLAALEHMASHDALTGLLNHAYAEKRIMERIENHPTTSYALDIFGLDHFKAANDTCGHFRYGQYKHFPISISMGIALASTAPGG